MKIDTEGNHLWEKSIDAPQGTKIRSIEDGYAISSCVWEWSPVNGDQQDFCLFKLDDQGNTKWKKVFGGESNDHLYDFDLTTDGGYILGGHTLSYNVENWDYLIIKVDGKGVEEWYKTFGQPRGYDAAYIHDESYGVRQTPDGGFIICGGSGDEYSYSESGHYSGPSDEWKVYLVRTNSIGDIIWEGIYPTWSTGNNAGEYIGLTNDGGYIVFVDTDSQSSPAPNNYGFMKIASDKITVFDSKDILRVDDFYLYQNYPNPFNPVTKIRYSIANPGKVEINVFNNLGIQVANLLNEYQRTGEYTIDFNGKNLTTGVYFCRLQIGKYYSVNKMLLIK